jgi:hypothetical protein
VCIPRDKGPPAFRAAAPRPTGPPTGRADPILERPGRRFGSRPALPDRDTGAATQIGSSTSHALTTEDLPELAWDHPDNPERIEFLAEFETRLFHDRRPYPAPLTVVTATGGQSSLADQAFWLELSPRPRQVEVLGGHDVYNDDPQAVAAEVLALAGVARSGTPEG